jgi:putative sugar O-methyltransferase
LQSSLYHPGPYWLDKSKSAADKLKNYGLKEFRSNNNFIGIEYADNVLIDIRNGYTFGWKRKVASWLTKQYPLNRIYDEQIAMTKRLTTRCLNSLQEVVYLSNRSSELLGKYHMPYSFLGNPTTIVTYNDELYSVHYLQLLDRHDYLTKKINFEECRSIFEIGPGFGVNIHILLENYPNIRKILYLDIPPYLYVGTQYLKSFYPDSVYDYNQLKKKTDLQFSKNNDLEIFCITPWQIEQFSDQIDLLTNANSFVEMPKNVVKNYATNFNRFPNSEKSKIALITYDGFDLNTTFHPDELTSFFQNRNFEKFTKELYLKTDAFTKKSIFYVG